MTQQQQKGFSLIEVLLALTIFTLTAGALLYLLRDGMTTTRVSTEHTIALGLAREGIAAASMLADEDMDMLQPGVHGLARSGDTWILSGAEDVTDGFTRTLAIEDIDVDTKQATSTVTWQSTSARTRSITLTTQFSDWQNTRGSAGDITVDTSGAIATSTMLSGITLANTGTSSRTIDAIRLYWEPNENLYTALLDLSVVYSELPINGATSGEVIDITDHVIPADETHELITFFSGDISGSDMTMTIFFSDASTVHSFINL